MCTGVRNLTIEDSNLNVKEIFSDSICYRKLDRRRIRKKVRKLERHTCTGYIDTDKKYKNTNSYSNNRKNANNQEN